MSEIDVLDGVGAPVELESGFKVNIVPLQLRQFLRLLRIFTAGASPDMLGVILSGEAPAQMLLAGLLTSVPEAEQQTVEFLVSMVEPAELNKNSKLTKPEAAHNQALVEELHDQLFNPKLEDSMTLIEAIVKSEAPHIESLGKRLTAMLAVAKKTGELGKPKSKSQKSQD